MRHGIFPLISLRCLTLVAACVLTAFCGMGAKPGIPLESWRVDSISEASFRSAISAAGRSSIEGIWQATADGATIGIIKDSHPHAGVRMGVENFLLVIVDSPFRSVPPGTVMGVATATADADRYDAWLYTRADGQILSKPRQFLLKLNDEAHLAFQPMKSGWKLNLWRLLPYVFRHSVTRQNTRPDNLDGCVRVYPRPQTIPPSRPLYL